MMEGPSNEQDGCSMQKHSPLQRIKLSQQNGCRMHTHSLLHRMRQKASGANRTVAKCTRICCYTECGKRQVEPTFPTAAEAEKTPKIKRKPETTILVNHYKV